MISGTRYRLSLEINRQTTLAREIARAQAEISTGKRLQAPSDDPTAAARISQLARAQADETAWISNLDSAAALSERADIALESLSSRIDRANELILSAASDTLSADNRETIASELRGIAGEVAALADSKDPRGGDLFRVGDPLEIPVHAGGNIIPIASRDVIFGNIATAAGLTDLEAIISDAAAAITDPDDATRKAATDASIDAIKIASTHVAAIRGNHGVTAHRIEDMRERLVQSGTQLTEQRTALESTDLVEAIARLQAKQLGLQAAQAVFARINQSTLFDLLR